MLLDTLFVRLKERFGDRVRLEQGRLELPNERAIVIPAAHPDVGDVVISDNGDEVIVGVGSITHEHFNPYDGTLSQEKAVTWISERVGSFLEDLFADRILLWSALRGTAGRWKRVAEPAKRAPRSIIGRWFVWSGPLSR